MWVPGWHGYWAFFQVHSTTGLSSKCTPAVPGGCGTHAAWTAPAPGQHLRAWGCFKLHKARLVVARRLQYHHCPQVLLLRGSKLGVAGGAEHGAQLAACSNRWWGRRDGAGERAGGTLCGWRRAAGGSAVLPACPACRPCLLACLPRLPALPATRLPACLRGTHWVCRGPGCAPPSCTACLGAAAARQDLHTPQYTPHNRTDSVSLTGVRDRARFWEEGGAVQQRWLAERLAGLGSLPRHCAQSRSAGPPSCPLRMRRSPLSRRKACARQQQAQHTQHVPPLAAWGVTCWLPLLTSSCPASTVQHTTAGTAGTSCDSAPTSVASGPNRIPTPPSRAHQHPRLILGVAPQHIGG